VPFFISLSKSEACDPVAVRSAITKGYARLVKEDMLSSMWVAKGSKYAASNQPIEEANGETEDEEPVTEIRIDGDETRVDVVSARSSIGDSPREATAPIVSLHSTLATSPTTSTFRKNPSSASLSTLGSSKSPKLVPRGDLFKVHVADAGSSEGASGFGIFKGKAPVAPFFKASLSDAARNWSPLENRKKPRKGVFGHVKSVLGYGSSSSQTTSEADDEHENGSPPSTPSVNHSSTPVVRPGEGIYCEWNPKTCAEFLKYDSDIIGSCEQVVDPNIEKELAKKKDGRIIDLEDCLDEFSKEETLGQDDLWYCPQVSCCHDAHVQV
jgi:ubiquitin carboxyl-terminal hydrolase 4/11/15